MSTEVNDGGQETNDISGDDLAGGSETQETYEDVVDEATGTTDTETPEGESEVEEEVEVSGEETEIDTEDTEQQPRFAQLKAKYPNLVKEFPEVKARWFQAEAYASVFPTVEDAQEANERIGLIDQLVDHIERGNSVPLIQTILESGPDSARSFAQNLLRDIHRVSPDMFKIVTLPFIHNMYSQMLSSAKQSNNEILAKTARNLSQYLFGSPVPPNVKGPDPEVEAERKRLAEERKQDAARKSDEFYSDVITRTETSLREELSRSIDPKKAMTEAVRQSAVDKIIKLLDTALKNDPTHMAKMKGFERLAQKEGYTEEVKRKLIREYRASAANHLPSLRQKVRAEFLGTGQPAKPKTGSFVPGAPAAGVRNRVIDPKKVDWSKTSDKDFLTGKNIHLKK